MLAETRDGEGGFRGRKEGLRNAAIVCPGLSRAPMSFYRPRVRQAFLAEISPGRGRVLDGRKEGLCNAAIGSLARHD